MKKIDINHSSLSSAFQHVKENHGCAGVDGVTIERFEENLDLNLARLRDEVVKQTYFPLPLLKILVEKKNGNPRSLCIPVVRDRVVETAVLQMIEPVLEKEFEECSFAYRKGRSVKQAVYKIKEYYVTKDIDGSLMQTLMPFLTVLITISFLQNSSNIYMIRISKDLSNNGWRQKFGTARH
jgi:retron-type reverse transcriptase